jgi:hypothetical protein
MKDRGQFVEQNVNKMIILEWIVKELDGKV